METRGRKRRFNPNIPTHIDQSKLPNGVYWSNNGHGFWYVKKPATQRIGGEKTTLAELHNIAEKITTGTAKNTFKWLSNEFSKSPDYKALKKGTKKDYAYCIKMVDSLRTDSDKEVNSLDLSNWTPPAIQRIVDKLVVDRGPSAANHALRYIRRVFAWAKLRGHCLTNPASGVKSTKEVGKHKMPSHEAQKIILTHAKECATKTAKTEGSTPLYVWVVLVVAYACRLRGVEVLELSERNIRENGILCERKKGSSTTITKWNPLLKSAITAAQKYRNNYWMKIGYAKPPNKDEWPIIISSGGGYLKKTGFDSTWQRFITRAIKKGIITEQQRFSPHGLKHRSVTDTPGNKADKKLASGHKSDNMVDNYDHSIPEVDPAES